MIMRFTKMPRVTRIAKHREVPTASSALAIGGSGFPMNVVIIKPPQLEAIPSTTQITYTMT